MNKDEALKLMIHDGHLHTVINVLVLDCSFA